MVLTEEWKTTIISPWWQWAQTRSPSNLSTDNPRSRPKPLSQYNKSKLRWSNLLCHFQSSKEDWESKYLKEDWASEKSACKSFPIRKTSQTKLLVESRTRESDFQKSTCKSASTSWETESRLYLNIFIRVTLFKMKWSFTLMTSVPNTLPFLSFLKVTYSWCDRGVRLENHFLFPIMCHEQPESISHLSSRPLSITYKRWEKVDDSVLGLVR
jgi:hypothetical protein